MKIAMLGIRGIPNCYSGFEVCAEEVASRLAKKGHSVTVYCRRHYFNLDSKTYVAHPGLSPGFLGRNTEPAFGFCGGRMYKDIKLVVLPTIKNKYLDTFIHTLLSTIHVLFTDAKIVQYFGVGNSIFAFLPRIFGKKTLINIDGLDWTRKKWPYPAKLYLRFSAFLATFLPTDFITDSQKIADYYVNSLDKKPAFISYGMPIYTSPSFADSKETLDKFGIQKNKYILFVGRLVPENNINLLISAYNQIKTDIKLVIVGDAAYETDYIKSLKNSASPNIIFTGFLSDEAYVNISYNAYIFVEPTEASGTHPAILDAMGFGSCVLVNNTPTNLETIGNAGLTYEGSEKDAGLKKKIELLLNDPCIVAAYKSKAMDHVRKYYSWDKVTEEYEFLYKAASAPANNQNK